MSECVLGWLVLNSQNLSAETAEGNTTQRKCMEKLRRSADLNLYLPRYSLCAKMYAHFKYLTHFIKSW